jgi:hypothetical protein
MQNATKLSVLSVSALTAMLLLAQTPPAPPAANAGIELTATTAKVSGAPDEVRFEILRWSTDEDRTRLMNAWSLKPDANDAKGKGKGGGKLGKAGAKQGKGGGKGGGAPVAEDPMTPERALTEALQEAPTVGYLWSSEAAGYAIRYAGKFANPDGSQRLVLISNRRLGVTNQQWNPTEGMPNTYEFSVIELRLNAQGAGEGKVSLTGTVAPDATAEIVTLQNYDALPVVFTKVQTKAKQP